MADPKEDVCFPEGKEVALAAARTAGKPLLTTANLNALGKDQQANKALAAEAIKDIPAFIRLHFYLTPSQNQQLNSLSPAQIGQLAKALQPVAASGGSVKFGDPVADPASKTKEGSFEISGPFGIGAKTTWKTVIAE
jgi:hypothetical protein